MTVWEGEKTGCEGFEPTVLREVKFPEMPTGSLVRSEGSQYCTKSLRRPAQGNRVTAVSKFTVCLAETAPLIGRKG